MFSTRRNSLSLVAAMVLAAGSAASADIARQPRLALNAGTLTLNGHTVKAATGRVVNQRAITFSGSPKVLVVWDEYSGAARTSWFALSLDGQKIDQVLPTDNLIRLRYSQFDPLAGVPVVPQALRAGPGNELFLVQFLSTPIDEMRRDITARGGVVEAFVPGNAHLVRMSPAARAHVAKLPYVRWTGPCEPAYRVSEEVRADILESPADAAPVRYSIACLRSGPAQQNAVADAIRAAGGMIDVTTPDQFRLEATINPARLAPIAAMNEVCFIDPWGGPGGTDTLLNRQLLGAVPLLSGLGFTGQGVRGELFDTEIRTTHQAFQTPPAIIRLGVTTGTGGDHGSATYGINFAHWPANPTYNGLCTDAEQGIFCMYQLASQFAGATSRLTFNTQAVDPAGTLRSCYQSSSVGSSQTSSYTTLSQETDDYLFRIDYLSFQSQSNLGTTMSRPQAWAKNIVSVGGIDWLGTPSRADDNVSAASFGPATDGRTKPDLANCYDFIAATWDSSDTGTTAFCCTSGATPLTAGCGGLLLQMWHQGVWAGFGGGSTVFSDRPFSTTAKAMLINTAYRYPLTQAGLTRARQGWGMPAVDVLYALAPKTFIVNANDPVENAQTKTYTVAVAAGEPELKATLCYIDPRPLVFTGVHRINDLSLRVTSPCGIVYWGNGGLSANNYNTAGGAADTINTVENVFIQNPPAGTWTVEVIGTAVVQDAYPTGFAGVIPVPPTDAGFSLVVTGISPTPPTSCYANCDASTTAPCLNVQDFSCFINQFAAANCAANCDESTTPPVLNVLDFTCFLNKFASGCSSC